MNALSSIIMFSISLFHVFPLLRHAQGIILRSLYWSEVPQRLWPLTCLYEYISNRAGVAWTSVDKTVVEETENTTNKPHVPNREGKHFFFISCDRSKNSAQILHRMRFTFFIIIIIIIHYSVKKKSTQNTLPPPNMTKGMSCVPNPYSMYYILLSYSTILAFSIQKSTYCTLSPTGNVKVCAMLAAQ